MKTKLFGGALVGAGISVAAASGQVAVIGDITNQSVSGSFEETAYLGDGYAGGYGSAYFDSYCYGYYAPTTWDFYTFEASVGDEVFVEVDRTSDGLDPVAAVYFGDADGLDFGDFSDVTSYFGSDLVFVATGDDEDPSATGDGPFSDPLFSFVAGGSGTYTLIVASYCSDTFNFADELSYRATVDVVPTPGVAGVLAVGAVVSGRRRR